MSNHGASQATESAVSSQTLAELQDGVADRLRERPVLVAAPFLIAEPVILAEFGGRFEVAVHEAPASRETGRGSASRPAGFERQRTATVKAEAADDPGETDPGIGGKGGDATGVDF
jgi:hypothetical protein